MMMMMMMVVVVVVVVVMHWGIETCMSFHVQLSIKHVVRLLVIRCKYLQNARYLQVQVQYCVHKNKSQGFTLSQINPVHSFISHFLKARF